MLQPLPDYSLAWIEQVALASLVGLEAQEPADWQGQQASSLGLSHSLPMNPC